MRYRVYGVALDSAVELPELKLADGTEPTSLSFSISTNPAPSSGPAFVYAHSTNDFFRTARCDGGYVQTFASTWRFYLRRDGREIVAHPPLPSPETMRHLLLDNVLPHALHLAGRDALHATAVLTPRGVIAFVGPSGAGKSTLAARCIAGGLTLVSDDCLVLALDGNGVVATPSYPGLRLLPDAVAWLGMDPSATTRVAEYGTKCRVRSEGAIAQVGGRLAAVYVLQMPALEPQVARVVVEALAKSEGFLELIKGSFRVDVDDRAAAKRQFDLFASVAERVPVRRLRVPRSLDAVDDAYAAVRADVGV